MIFLTLETKKLKQTSTLAIPVEYTIRGPQSKNAHLMLTSMSFKYQQYVTAS